MTPADVRKCATTGVYPGGLKAGTVICTHDELSRWLGGSGDSFTGVLLHLIAKADPGNRARLTQAFPLEVAAWLVWQGADPAPTAEELAWMVVAPGTVGG